MPRKKPESTKPLRVVFYTRISTDEDHQKYSLGAQRDRLKAYCDGTFDNWTLHKVYADQASGTKLNRIGLTELRREAKQGRFDIILVFKVDRLSRKVRHLSRLVDEFQQHEVALKSATEPFDTSTSAGIMMLQMLGVFAQFEHSNIIERTKAGMRRNAENGGWNGGGIPYGYDCVEGEGITINEEEATVVKKIFELYTNDHVGAKTVARTLNDAGHRRKSGTRWRSQDILHIIRRPVYAGIIRWADVEQEGVHDRIIDKEQWNKANDILEKRSKDRSASNSVRSERLLAGNIFCGVCGSRMSGVSGKKNGVKHAYYACTKRVNHGKTECGLDYIRADTLEHAIIEQVRQVAADPDVLDAIVAAANEKLQTEKPEVESLLKAVDAKLDKVRKSLDRYFQAFESGSMDPVVCGERINNLNEQMEDLQAERINLRKQADRMVIELSDGKIVRKFLEIFDEIMKKGAPASKRKHLISGLVPRIVVYSKEEIEVYFRAPISLVRVMDSLAPAVGLEPTT